MINSLKRPSGRVMYLCLLAALLIGALAACSQAADTGIPTASEGQDASAGEANSAQPEATPAEQDREDRLLSWSQCIRDHGIAEFPDPDSEGRLLLPRGRIDPDSAEFQEATDACRHLAPEGWGDETADPADMEVMLKFARCMRENGVPDYPDPSPDSGNRISLERNNPKSQEALEACREILEELRGGPRIGG